MNLKDTLSTKRLLFLLIFTVLVFAGNRENEQEKQPFR